VRAAILEEFGQPLLVEDVELRPPGPREVIVRINATAVCITDTLAARGVTFSPPPAILGHAGAGVLEEVGTHVERVRPGDRVVIAGTPVCGECYWCVRGQPEWCVELINGVVPPRHVATRADGQALTADGGVGTYAELMNVRDIGVVAVDTTLPDEQLCLLGCGVTSGLGAVFNLAEVEPGSSVAVVGCGHLGLWMIQAARVPGATQIIAIEPQAERRALAGEVGATDLVDPADGDPVEQVQALTGGRGADCTLEAAGSSQAMEQAFSMTRRAGTFVPTGMEKLEATVTLPAIEFAVGSRRIHGCQYGGARIRRDIPRFAKMLETGLIDAGPIVSRRFSLDEVNEAFRAAEAREVITGIVEPSSAVSS
jgi:S-(hydroxymethyl)glutathione dehydrogenase / alcohol dehydrogenase